MHLGSHMGSDVLHFARKAWISAGFFSDHPSRWTAQLLQDRKVLKCTEVYALSCVAEDAADLEEEEWLQYVYIV